MTMRRLLLHTILRFWRTNLGVALGLAVAATVITGALIVGDSMRFTLGNIATQRLGNVHHAVIGGDRFFTNDLAQSLSPESAGVVMLEAVVSSPDSTMRANGVTVLGIDEDGAALIGTLPPSEPGNANINSTLANHLGAKQGDTLILRVPEPSALPIDAALVNASKPAIAIRFTVDQVVDSSQGGRFSLRAEQRPPMNLYVDRAWLAEQLEQPGRVNVAFSETKPVDLSPTLSDLDLDVRTTPDGKTELTTPRVFLDASIEQDLAELSGTRLLTYMANTIAHGDKQSPYAMVTAANNIEGLNLSGNQIAINQWLAADLDAGVGDTVSMTYYLPDEGDRLIETTSSFTVAQIVPIEGPFADRTLTPDFPGLAEAETLRRWDAGPAIDRSRIRDKDEAYWDAYRATPKAFINFETGQKLWSNRFGTLTAIRFEKPVTDDELMSKINTAALGFIATDLQAQAAEAAVGTVDFGQLFLSLSGFIIIAAIILAATLFAMSAEQRSRQIGLMLALGLSQRQVLGLMVCEAFVVAIIGAGLGLLGGIGYGYGVVGALSGVWAGAVADAPIELAIRPISLIIGPIGAIVIGTLAILLSVRALTRWPIRALLSGAVGKVSGPPKLPAKVWGLVAITLIIAAGALSLISLRSDGGMMGALMGFGAGALMLAGLIGLLVAILVVLSVAGSHRNSAQASTQTISTTRLAGRNLTRRRGRTLAAISTLGCGVFMVIAVTGFRLGTVDDPTNRASGTGGFALLVEASTPIRYDLNTQLGREHYVLSEDELPPGSVVPVRVSGGDDASCLNLNQTPTPRLLGVDPSQLNGSFTFQQEQERGRGWQLLDTSTANPNAIPAIADANTAQWALKLAIGDTFTMNDEIGQPFTLELVGTIENSILQGSLIIHEQQFKQLYPSTSGYRMLLIEPIQATPEEDTASLLNEVLVDEGVSVTTTADRLAQYNTVQNTYLSIFQLLGGLGVVLGALGLGVITARNLIERRAELALLFAIGLTRQHLSRIIMIEQGFVLIAGLMLGLIGAAVATAHTGHVLGGALMSTLATSFAVLGVGLAAVLCGIASAGLGRLTTALRND